ncbi:MAG: HutD family protein, partial [Polaromonas sp.]
MNPAFSLQRFARDQLPVTPWKNGGGNTREIACWPPGAGLNDFGWRISIATIAASGPFSMFAGIDRHIMLLGGDGVRLRSPGSIDHQLDTPGQPFAFSGDAAIDCTLLGGESSDFNVM